MDSSRRRNPLDTVPHPLPAADMDFSAKKELSMYPKHSYITIFPAYCAIASVLSSPREP